MSSRDTTAISLTLTLLLLGALALGCMKGKEKWEELKTSFAGSPASQQ